MEARALSPAQFSPGCSSSCDRGRFLYHPQGKESQHGKACSQAQSQAQPVQEKALLTVTMTYFPSGTDWIEQWSHRNAGLEYTGI